MKLLILSRKKDVYSTKRLTEEGQKSGHQIILMDPEDPDIHKISGDLLIPRIGSYKYQDSLAILEWFERRGTPVLTKTAAFRDARNKWYSYLILKEEGVPVPYSLSMSKPQLPKKFPYIVKEPESIQGQGVWLIRSSEELMKVPHHDELLYQEAIQESFGKDIRVFVIDGKVCGAIERRANQPNEFRANLHLGGTAHAVTITEQESSIAIAATKALGLKYAGVDILRSNKGPLVLEANASPGFEGLERTLGINVAGKLIELCEKIHLSHT